MSYACEKFNNTIYDLATGENPLRQRLADAYSEHIAVISEENIPEEIKAEFTQLSNYISRAENQGEGTIVATIKELEHSKILEIVEKIMTIYQKLCTLEDF